MLDLTPQCGIHPQDLMEKAGCNAVAFDTVQTPAGVTVGRLVHAKGSTYFMTQEQWEDYRFRCWAKSKGVAA